MENTINYGGNSAKRCGSVTVDLALKFSSTVRESEVLSILRDAAENGKFGDFHVSAITGTRDTGIKTTLATTPASPSDGKQTFVCLDLGSWWNGVSSKMPHSS